MNFTFEEIEKAKELYRLKLKNGDRPKFAKGSYITARHCPKGYEEISPQVFLVTDPAILPDDLIWLPTFDELLTIAKHHKISFAQITDFLHRRRFADGREREGLYHLLIEALR